MSRSSLFPAVLVCFGLVFSAIANTRPDAAATEPAAAAKHNETPKSADSQSLEQRVEKLELQLAERQAQGILGAGFLAIDPIVANLDDARLSRYIKVSIVLSVDEGQQKPAFEALAQIDPKIRDWLYAFLSGKTVEDVRGQVNQQQMRMDIQAGINSQLKSAGYPQFAKAALFEEINVQ